MEQINKVKSISIWVFIVPFVAVNTCLIITTQLHFLIEHQYAIYYPFPYIDGGVSISRTARYFPTYLIFKPAMFLTAYLLIIYWLNNRKIINHFDKKNKYKNKIVYFGIASAIALILHSIFLGIKFDNDLYKLFRRLIMFIFIVFEVTAQAYLVAILYSFKDQLIKFINVKVLRLKLILVSILVVVAVIAIPVVSWPGNQFKFIKHLLEWDYFLGVIGFYLLTYLMWRKKKYILK